MLNLKLTEEQRIVREQARKWFTRELEPHLEKMDNHEITPYEYIRRFAHEIVGSGDITSVQQLEEIVANRDFITTVLLGIEVSRASPGFAMSMGATYSLTCFAILRDGTPEQKEKYTVDLARFDKIGALAITEPEAGSDVLGMKSTATKDGDHYVLNGSKTFITNAPYADIFVIYAKAPGGISAFLVERGAEGLTTGKPLEKMGMRASPTGEIFMDDVRIHESQILGDEGKGLYNLFAVLQNERAHSPAMSIGIMERCIDESVRYAKQRVQFGRPIIKFQGMQFMMARMWTALLASYSFLFTLGELLEQGTDISIMSSAAKLYTTEKATEVAMDAIQIMGGYGYMKEYKVERFARDAKLMEIGAGTSQIQMLIMGRKLADTDEPELNPLLAGPDPFGSM